MKIKIDAMTIETDQPVETLSFSVSAFGNVDCEKEPASENCMTNNTNLPCNKNDLLYNLDEISWEEITQIGASGKAREKFALGATKTISLSEEMIVCRIIGFKHDDAENGTKAPISWEMVGLMNENHCMNETWTNQGGWRESEMRRYLNEDVYAKLPKDLQSVIRPVLKITSKGSGSAELEETTDQLWLLSEKERFGRAVYSVKGEGRWYEYYRLEDVEYGKKHQNGKGDSDWMWERSPYSGSSSIFCRVYSIGSAYNSLANYSRGVAFGFCV